MSQLVLVRSLALGSRSGVSAQDGEEPWILVTAMGMLWGWKLPQMRARRACVLKGLHVCNPAYGALEEPWSPPSTPRMRAAFEESPPEAFRRRNLILSHSALFHSFAQ